MSYIILPYQEVTKVAGTKIVPSRSLHMNAVLPCSIGRHCATKREAAPRGKNWQKRRVAGSARVRQPLDLDGTIFVPATLMTVISQDKCFLAVHLIHSIYV
jgi:hypothetical protein